jgi:hypothetical protein
VRRAGRLISGQILCGLLVGLAFPYSPQKPGVGHWPHDNHGKPDYLLIEDLEKSAKIDGFSLDEAVRNLVKTVEVAKKESGQHHK